LELPFCGALQAGVVHHVRVDTTLRIIGRRICDAGGDNLAVRLERDPDDLIVAPTDARDRGAGMTERPVNRPVRVVPDGACRVRENRHAWPGSVGIAQVQAVPLAA